MFLFFHDIGVPAAPFYLMGFIGLVVAPILSALGVYRIVSGQIGENVLRKSLITIGIFIIICGLLCSLSWYLEFFWWIFEDIPKFKVFPYLTTIPFGFPLSIIIWITTGSAIPGLFVGVILNLTSMICWFSILENRKNKKKD